MFGLAVLWMPIVVSAVLVTIALVVVHMIPGWHQGDMAAVPGEDRVMETLRGLDVRPGEYRFPWGSTTAEMTSPEFVARMKAGPVGMMTIRPSGELNMGKMLGQWFVYALVAGVLVALVTGRTFGRGAPYLEVFCVSGTVAFCCHAVAHWQNWIWWGKGTRYTLTYSADGLLYALVTAGAFGWLWPR